MASILSSSFDSGFLCICSNPSMRLAIRKSFSRSKRSPMPFCGGHVYRNAGPGLLPFLAYAQKQVRFADSRCTGNEYDPVLSEGIEGLFGFLISTDHVGGNLNGIGAAIRLLAGNGRRRKWDSVVRSGCCAPERMDDAR